MYVCVWKTVTITVIFFYNIIWGLHSYNYIKLEYLLFDIKYVLFVFIIYYALFIIYLFTISRSFLLSGFLLMYAFATETIYAMFIKDSFGYGERILSSLFAFNGFFIGKILKSICAHVYVCMCAYVFVSRYIGIVIYI